MLGEHAVRHQVSGRQSGGPRGRSRPGVVGLRLAARAHRGRQPAVAVGELDRQLGVRGRYRGLAPRPVPPSDRPRAGIFRGSVARNTGEPRLRDLECGLHRREHVRLECAAAMRRDRGGDCVRRHRQHADGVRPDAGCRRDGGCAVPPRCCRPAAPSRFCRQGGCGGRRDGRRHQQHAAGLVILRPAPRASQVRCDGRARNGSRGAAACITSRDCASCTPPSPSH